LFYDISDVQYYCTPQLLNIQREHEREISCAAFFFFFSLSLALDPGTAEDFVRMASRAVLAFGVAGGLVVVAGGTIFIAVGLSRWILNTLTKAALESGELDHSEDSSSSGRSLGRKKRLWPGRKGSRDITEWMKEELPFDFENLQEPSDSLKLKAAVVIHRHGDRTPLAPIGGALSEEEKKFWISRLPLDKTLNELEIAFPTDGMFPQREAEKYPCCRLTQRGIEQQRSLGNLLRQRYHSRYGIISGLPLPSEISAESTSFSRTRQSVQALLDGLFPSDIRGKAKIPVKLQPLTRETIFPLPNICARLSEAMEKKRTEIVRSAGWFNVYESTRKALGYSSVDKVKLVLIREHLICNLSHGLPLPLGIQPHLVDMIEQRATYEWRSLYKDPTILRLGIGRFLGKILDNLVAHVDEKAGMYETEGLEPVRKGRSAPKLFVYSGHDTTIIPLFEAFEMDKEVIEWPPYSSYFIIELYEDQSPGLSSSASSSLADETSPQASRWQRHKVRVIYNGRDVFLPWSSGSAFVSFPSFYERWIARVPVHYDRECVACGETGM